MPRWPAQLAPGAVLGGRYRLLREIGSGASARVFEAEHAWTGRHVAVKVLAGGEAMDSDLAGRFVAEARSAARLVHPNVVLLFDVDRDNEGGELFLVQELLEGGDLEQLRVRRGRLTWGEALDLVLPIMDALVYAHSCGVVHRDVKPSNVALGRDAHGAPVPKLIDFGLSRIVGDTALAARLTRTGMMLGTPAYMAPEQMRSAATAGPACDVWAIGVMLYELVSGRLPYDGEGLPGLVRAILEGVPTPLPELAPDVPKALADVIHRALERKVPPRPRTMHELIVEICAASGRTLPSASAAEQLRGESSAWKTGPNPAVLQRGSAPAVASDPPGAARRSRGAADFDDATTRTEPNAPAFVPAGSPPADFDDDATIPSMDMGPALAALSLPVAVSVPLASLPPEGPTPLRERRVSPAGNAEGRPAVPLRFGLVGPLESEHAPTASLEALLGLPVAFVHYHGYAELVAALSRAELELAWLAPIAYARARRQGAAGPLAGLERRGRPGYRSALLGRPGLRGLEDLRGARAAWVDPWSAGGCVVPRAELARHGLPPDTTLGAQAFVASYEAALEAVMSGRADICAQVCGTDTSGHLVPVGWSPSQDLTVLLVSEPIPCEVLGIAGYIDEEIAAGLGARLRRRVARNGLGLFAERFAVSALSPVDDRAYMALLGPES